MSHDWRLKGLSVACGCGKLRHQGGKLYLITRAYQHFDGFVSCWAVEGP